MKVDLEQTPDGLIISVPIDGIGQFDSSILPKDREFRDAWELKKGKVVINISKAIQIWQGKIRKQRDRKLKQLDVEWMRALEQGKSKIAASIASQKQVLRDLPEREELTRAKTVDEIKKFWPSILND